MASQSARLVLLAAAIVTFLGSLVDGGDASAGGGGWAGSGGSSSSAAAAAAAAAAHASTKAPQLSGSSGSGYGASDQMAMGMLRAGLAAAGLDVPTEILEEAGRLTRPKTEAGDEEVAIGGGLGGGGGGGGGGFGGNGGSDDWSPGMRIAAGGAGTAGGDDAGTGAGIGKKKADRLSWKRLSSPATSTSMAGTVREHDVVTAVNRSVIVASAGSIASMRAAVTAHNSSYLEDHYAAVFARQVCPERLSEAMKKTPQELARFAVRTRHFDELVRDAIHVRGIDQVVIIAAGFDARGMRGKDMRFHEIPEMHVAPPSSRKGRYFDEQQRHPVFFEVDLPELIEAKRALLESMEGDSGQGVKDLAKNAPEIVRVGVDVVQDDWLQVLRLAGFNPERPACFVLEGFLYYFDEETVRRVVSALSAIAKEGSRIGASAVSSAISENSTRFVWGTDDPEGFFTGYGWEGVQARQYGDPSIAAGWPLGDDEMRRAARPRSETDVKRTWYVTGTKGKGKLNWRDNLVDKVEGIVDRVRPVVDQVAPWVIKVATGGLKIVLPIPGWMREFTG